MSNSTAHRLHWLRAQLLAGWTIEGRAIERQVRSGYGQQITALEFLLRGREGCLALAIDDGPELQSFLRERQIERVAL